MLYDPSLLLFRSVLLKVICCKQFFPSIHAILFSPMLLDSFIRSPLVGAAVFVAFKTAVPFLCTAVGKQICSFDSPLSRKLNYHVFLVSNYLFFPPLCEFSIPTFHQFYFTETTYLQSFQAYEAASFRAQTCMCLYSYARIFYWYL